MSEVNKLFDKIKNGGLSQTEILNLTREFTNDYDPELLEAFYYDLRQYIDFLEDGFLAELKNIYPDWSKYIKKEFTDKNLEVPTEKIPKLETTTKPKDEWEYHLVLDWKKVFWKDYSREFILLLDFRRIIQNKLEVKKDPLGHNKKPNLSPFTTSNTGTPNNTPEDGEATTAATKETKSDKLRAILTRYGFFELKRTKDLSKNSQDKLISEIVKQGTPFAIALFQELGYFSYLEPEHFASKKETNKNLAEWLVVTERTISGNRNVLITGTSEDKTRYTSHEHKENVKKLLQSK